MKQNKILTTTPTKDLLPNNKSQFFKFIKCKECKIEKHSDEFNKNNSTKNKLHYKCKNCQKNYDYQKRKTLKGCLKGLLDNSKNHSKNRKDKGREDAGIFDITLSDLKNLWEKQDGKCYYSNIPMNYDKRDWKVSLERLNPDKGYIKDNIVLCCQEFNNQTQWSKEKIKEMIEILNEDIIRHTFSFELEKKKYKERKKIIKTIINNIEYYNCNHCNEIKTIDMFYKSISNGCKSCNYVKDKIFDNTPVGKLKLLVKNAKNHINNRIKTNNNKRDNSFNIDYDYIVELYNKQKGLCAYSKLPLQFGSYFENNWICSLERIDVLKGYIKGNVCLICLEFNTFDRSILYKNNEKGSCGWSKEKFNYFLTFIPFLI